MILETDRLYLREMNQADYGALCKILQDEETMYAYEGAFDDEEVQEWLDRQLSRYQRWGFGLWAVILKETGKMIGQCGLTMQPWKDEEVLEIGYLFQRRYWHKGYAIEAAKACKKYAFEVLQEDEVCSIIRDTNTASQNVAVRNGMVVVDHWVKHYRGVDMPHDRYAVTRLAGGEEKQDVIYRLAEESDIDAVCGLIKAAVSSMEKRRIFQWDDIYPAREDFLDDIRKQQLYIGIVDDEVAVVYTVNKECDKEYENGNWKYPDCEYRIIHRLCVNPAYQNRGIAKDTLSHIEQELRNRSIEAVRLDAFSENPFALSLYQKAGYEKVGVADWRKGRFYLMEKRL